ncbi:hypothetical protein MTYP_00321 [Methylophilaceae bacterium]|nr:hypothetical protein MTYP_00321 [Methylophilaceae bacterium]
MNMGKVSARRALLLQRIAQQRAELGLWSQSLEPAAKILDSAYAVARLIKLHPKLALGAAIMTFIVMRKYLPVARISVAMMTAAKWWLFLKKPTAAPLRK